MSRRPRTPLRGTEVASLELTGGLAPEPARTLIGDGLDVEERADGSANVGLLVFRMDRLCLGPLPGLGYHEALWRVGVVTGGQRLWLAIACYIDRALVRALGRRLIGYPTRTGQLTLHDEEGALGVRLQDPSGSLSLEAQPMGTGSPAVPPRRTLVRSGRKLLEVPWDEGPSRDRHDAAVTIETDELSAALLGEPVRWDRSGVILHGRAHRCGLARVAQLD